MRTRRSVAVVGFVVLLLAGCTSSEEPEAPATTAPTESAPNDDAEPPASPEPSAEPTPTEDPVDPHPALADLIITTSGLGPLTVGGTPPADNPGAAMVAWEAEFCSGEGWAGDGDPGRWVPSGYKADTNYMGEPATPFYVDATDAGVHRIDVMGTGPHTEEGVRIGTTLTVLRATYPGLSGPFAGPVSQVWWLSDTAGHLAFETQGGDMIAPGAPEQVILIRVLAPSWPPEFATANSGDVAGACF